MSLLIMNERQFNENLLKNVNSRNAMVYVDLSIMRCFMAYMQNGNLREIFIIHCMCANKFCNRQRNWYLRDNCISNGNKDPHTQTHWSSLDLLLFTFIDVNLTNEIAISLD